VGGGFFERFQQRVERIGRQHMDFIDDIDFIFDIAGEIFDFIAEFPDIVDAGIAGGVDFDDVADRSVLDPQAIGADVARIGDGGVFAVDRFRKNTGDRGFSGSARSGEQIGVGDLIVFQGVFQRGRDMFLTGHFVEIGGTVGTI